MKTKMGRKLAAIICALAILVTGNALAEASTAAVRPQDNFYEAIDGQLLAEKEIPATSYQWNYMYDLSENAYAALDGVVQECVANIDEYEPTDYRYKIAALYTTVMDFEGRNARGLDEAMPYVDLVANAQDTDQYLTALATIYNEIGAASALNMSVMVNPVDSGKYCLAFNQPDTGLGRDYYELDGAEELIAYYQQVLQQLLTLAGDEKATDDAATTLAFMQDVAGHCLNAEDASDYEKTINMMDHDELQAILTNIDLDELLDAFGMADATAFCVTDVDALKYIDELFTQDHLEEFKTYTKSCLILDLGGMLTKDMSDIANSFNHMMTGQAEALSDERVASETAQGVFGEELGQLYVQEYFSEEKRAAVEDIIYKALDVYRKRLTTLDWMSEETRAKAIKKLDTMKVYVGYPDKVQGVFADVTFKTAAEGGTLIENNKIAVQASHAYMQNLLNEAVDPTIWPFPPQTVNAGYMPNFNSICFPAAILQAPYFDENASFAQNMGGIGTVIAHEITHAFDDAGAKFDENGDMKNWWTDADLANFQEKVDAISAYYSRQETPYGMLNGDMTSGENIADLGGVSCALEIVGDDPADQKAFFENYANIWAQKVTPEVEQLLYISDVHAPNDIRVNAVLSSIDAFYDVYDVQEGDGMYCAPEDRVHLW